MRESVGVRGRRLLLEGRVHVVRVDDSTVMARVRGDSAEVHHVEWHRGEDWTCSCTAGMFHRRCAHEIAVMLVTIVNNGRKT